LVAGAGSSRADPPRARIEPRLARALADRAAADTEMRRQTAERRVVTRAGELAVVIEPLEGRGADSLPLEELRSLGARVSARSRSFARVTATPEVLRRAAELGGIRALRFPLEPIPVDGAGTPVSESVALTGASALQALGIDGSGVKVAVIDVGFIGLAGAKTMGNIPASAVELDLVGMGMETNTGHGTAVTEQVADMAPGAQLYTILFGDEVDLENAIDYMRDNGIKIANLSVNFFATSYYDDTGPINGLVNQAHDVDGVFWAVGGGNWGFRHWRGAWQDEDGDRWQSFGTPNDERLETDAELNQMCWTLNWNQYPGRFDGPLTDLDLYAYSNTGALVSSSQNRQVQDDLPIEQVCFPRIPMQEPYSLGVRRFWGPTAQLDLTLLSSSAAVSGPNQVPPSSVVDPAVAHGAFAVGAVHHVVWSAPVIENFSSRGPTIDGRVKPDIVAPDRTATYQYGAALGTSFAAPVAAGAAALLVEQLPGITANQIRAALVNAAVDIGDPGKDSTFGWGKIVVPFLVLPLDSDEDAVPDSLDPCPFTSSPTCVCGDVDGSGAVMPFDEGLVRAFLTDPAPTTALFARKEQCNVIGPAAPFPLDCRIDDWAILRRARAGLGPFPAPVCASALPP